MACGVDFGGAKALEADITHRLDAQVAPVVVPGQRDENGCIEYQLPPDEVERREQRRYARLYQAVNTLSPTLRRSIIESYGLFGEPARTNHELASTYHITKRAVNEEIYGQAEFLPRN